MREDPSVDQDKLHKYHGKNYTEMLKLEPFNRRDPDETDED